MSRNLDEAFFLNEWVARSIFKKTVVRLPAYQKVGGRWSLYTSDFNWRNMLSPVLVGDIDAMIDEDDSVRLMPCWKVDDTYTPTPDFSGDLSAAHRMEDEIRSLGFRDHYITALIATRSSSQDFYWYLLHEASPLIRCLTAKQIVVKYFDEIQFEGYKKNFFA